MKLELTREVKDDGEIYYKVYVDGRIRDNFYVGNEIKEGEKEDEDARLRALSLYNRLKNPQKPSIRVLLSEEI